MFGIRTLFYQKTKETRFLYKKLIKSEETYYDNQRKTIEMYLLYVKKQFVYSKLCLFGFFQNLKSSTVKLCKMMEPYYLPRKFKKNDYDSDSNGFYPAVSVLNARQRCRQLFESKGAGNSVRGIICPSRGLNRVY